MTRIHLDTDLGGDPDDACALAMLLGWPDAEIVGITTTIDPGGQRAACVAHCLRLAGREDIPLVAGAEVSSSTDAIAAPIVGDDRHWPIDLAPRPSPPNAAPELLARSVARGATIVAIGPLTNLARLETARPGILRNARVVAMGGWLRPPADGLPAWGPAMDWNIQWDVNAAEIVAAAAGELTLVTLPATLRAQLRAADLPRLRASGPLGASLARQSEAHGHDEGMIELGRTHPALPDDLLNFHYDPVACAVALGWPGATIDAMRLRIERDGELLRFRPDPRGRPVRVVVEVDGARFRDVWLAAVEAAQREG